MTSTPVKLPSVPRRAVWSLAAASAVLTVVAAFLKSLDALAYSVLGDVAGTAAGVLLGATGLAGIVETWQRRQQLVDAAPSTSVVLNTAARDVERLTLTVLEMLAAGVPAVSIAGPNWLGPLVAPPFDEEVAQVVTDLCREVRVHGGRSRADSAWKSQVEFTNGHLATIQASAMLSDEVKESLSVRAVISPLSALVDVNRAALTLRDLLGTQWEQVPRLVDALSAVGADLETTPLAGVRSLQLASRGLQAAVHAEGPAGPSVNKLGDTYEVQAALNALVGVLEATIRTSRELSRVREEFVNIKSDDEEMKAAQFNVSLHQAPTANTRGSNSEVIRILLLSAWRELANAEGLNASTSVTTNSEDASAESPGDHPD